MGLFSLGNKNSNRYGVIVDIGSGSVSVGIVHSDSSKQHPTVIWSHREHAPLKNVDSLNDSIKSVAAALMQATMKLDSEGRKTLRTFDADAKLVELQVGIAAPWAYTVTKTLNYAKDGDSFTISTELIDELAASAEEKTQADIKKSETLTELGLEIISQSTVNLIANGYRVKDAIGQTTEALDLSRATVVAQTQFTTAVTEIHDKLFQGTQSRSTSSMLMMYCVAQDVMNGVDDFCLVDITYEATEIGIVRDGILQYCTHESHGAFSLAREISMITDIPLYEAFGYLSHDPKMKFLERLSDTKKDEVKSVFKAYSERLTDLFHQTGDSLSIPKRIFLNSDLKSNKQLSNLVAKAAKKATLIEPQLLSFPDEIVDKLYEDVPKSDRSKNIDLTALISAQFFHKRQHCSTINYQ